MSSLLPAARRVLGLLVLALLALGSAASLLPAAASAQEDGAEGADGSGDADGAATTQVEVLPFDGFFDPPVAGQLVDVLAQSRDEGSDLLVLQIDSGGGVSVDLDDLQGRLDDAGVPVAGTVGPLGTGADAAGAAGLLWLASDVRTLASDATVGPLQPLDLAADERDDAARVRELVTAAGGDEALADELLSGEVGAERLVEAGVADYTAAGLEPLLVELDGAELGAGGEQLRTTGDAVSVRFHSLGLIRRLLHAATTAPFIYLLLVVGLGLLLFEVFQPGFGVAGLAGLITAGIGAFGLWVLPVTWWAVGLVVLGMVLYAVDTAIAGFGPVTLAATASLAAGSWWFYDAEALQLPGWLVAATVVTALAFFVLVMTTVLRAQAGPEGVAVDELVGRVGTVRSMLNPEGHVYIDGALWRARWTGEAKRAKVGTPVQVHAVDGPVVLVEAFDPEQQRAGRQAQASAHDEG